MNSTSGSNEIPEPLRTVMRDYLHVEWYELHEFAADVKAADCEKKFGSFKLQLRAAILTGTPSIETVYALTGQEFESQDQLVTWLKEVWTSLYHEGL